MTTEQLKQAHTAQPFRPFTIRVADGRSFPIPHPEFLAVHPKGRTIFAADLETDAFSILDLLLVTEIEFHDTETSSPS